VDWDQLAGERWALFIGPDDGLAQVSVLAPLLIATESFDGGGMDLARFVVVRVPSLQDEVLSCDPTVLLTFFTEERFSAESPTPVSRPMIYISRPYTDLSNERGQTSWELCGS
jgi:hypothetical protein